MSASVGIDNFGRKNLPVFCLIHFKLLCMAKMLKDLAVLIGYCLSLIHI